MKLAHAIAFGIFILILAYLGFTNPQGVATIFNAGGGQTANIIKTLQARG